VSTIGCTLCAAAGRWEQTTSTIVANIIITVGVLFIGKAPQPLVVAGQTIVLPTQLQSLQEETFSKVSSLREPCVGLTH
jgi:hypothetical protein